MAPDFETLATQGCQRQHAARLLGITTTRLDSWRKRGCPAMPDGRFRVALVVEWLERKLAAKVAVVDEESEKSLGRLRRVRADRETLRLQQDRGELVARDEVIDAIVTAIHFVKARFRNAQRKLAPRLYQAPSIEWIDEELGAEFNAICKGFAQGMQSAAPDVPGAAHNDLPPADVAGTNEAETDTSNKHEEPTP